jgi:hypothetical protein
MSDEYEYSETDMDALRGAMEIALRDPGRKEQLESKVNGYRGVEPEPWTEVAEFAAFCVQSRTFSKALGEPAMQRVRRQGGPEAARPNARGRYFTMGAGPARRAGCQGRQ